MHVKANWEKGDEKTTVGFMSENIELVVVVKVTPS